MSSSFVTLPATKLGITLQSGGSSCSAMCFTHLRDEDNKNNNNHTSSSNKNNNKESVVKAKAEALIDSDEATSRNSLFSCLGWFASNQLSNRHVIEVLQIRNTEVGTLHSRPFSEVTVRLDEKLFAASETIKVHSLVPCYRFGISSKTTSDESQEDTTSRRTTNALHDEMNNKSVYAVAAVISNEVKGGKDHPQVVFLVPNRNNSSPNHLENEESSTFYQKREESFRKWLKQSSDEQAQERLQNSSFSNRNAASPPMTSNNNEEEDQRLAVDVTTSIALTLPEKSSSSSLSSSTTAVVSVKDATGASEDVTLWVSKFSSLLVGCEGGKIFAVSPSCSNNNNNASTLVFNDESAGTVVQIAECSIHQNRQKDNVCSFVVSCINKAFVIEVQMKVASSNNNKITFQILSNKPIGTKPRVGVFGGCSLTPLKEDPNHKNDEKESTPTLLPPVINRLDAAITLALRPNFRMYLCDSTTGNVKQTLPLPQNPRVPGIRSLRDITKQVDRRIFSTSTTPPSCLALCVARNQVCLLDVFALKYVAVQQLTSDVLTSLQEDADKQQQEGAIDEYASVPESSRTTTDNNATSARTTGRGGAGGSGGLLDQALMAKGPSNVRSVQIVMGVFLVILLQSGEINVVSMGKVSREFCEALMVLEKKKALVEEEQQQEETQEIKEDEEKNGEEEQQEAKEEKQHHQEQTELAAADKDESNENKANDGNTIDQENNNEEEELERQRRLEQEESEKRKQQEEEEEKRLAKEKADREIREEEERRQEQLRIQREKEEREEQERKRKQREKEQQERERERQRKEQEEKERREAEEQEKERQRQQKEQEEREMRLNRKDDIEEFIENCENEFIQYDSEPSSSASSLTNLPKNTTLGGTTFFSSLADLTVRLCARVRGLNKLSSSNNNNNNDQNNGENDDDKTKEQQRLRIVHTIGLCRNLSKLLPDLFRFAQIELSKPLTDRRKDSNMFRKDDVKRRLSAIILAPLCFFEHSSLSESFQDISTSLLKSDTHDGAVYKNVPVNAAAASPSTASASSTSKPNTFVQTESPQDIAFANATRAAFKLLRSLKLLTWSLGAVLIYLLHRRRSLSMSVSMMSSFEMLHGPVGTENTDNNNNNFSETSSPTTTRQSSSSATLQKQHGSAVINVSGEYLRKKPLPGCEPLITRSSRHHPLPHLLSAAMMIARRIINPSVPFFGATVIDAQEDTLAQSFHNQQENCNSHQDFSPSSSGMIATPPKVHATASTGAQIDFENLAKNVEKSIREGDGSISDYFPALPDIFTRSNSNSKSSLTLIRNQQAQQQNSTNNRNNQNDDSSSMFYEYYDDDNDYDNNNTNSSGSNLKSAINIFEACYCEPDAVFVDYSVHTILTLVYLPFINVVLPTKATIAAWTQLAWEAMFDQQWIEWAVTCPRLREDIYYYLKKVIPESSLPQTIQKRLPSGMTMSAVLCDQILPYLVQLRGDPRANLCLSPILRGGVTGLSSSSSSSSNSNSNNNSNKINHWEIDVVLSRRLSWCLHVFLFEYASIISKLHHELEKNQKLLMEKQLEMQGGGVKNSSIERVQSGNNLDRYDLRASVATAMSFRSGKSGTGGQNSSSSSSSNSSSSPDQSHLAIQRRFRRLRQTDAWIEELILGLKTCFSSRDRASFNALLRGLSELACAFNHGKSLVDLEGFNSVVDRLVSVGDVGALFPIIQYMDENHLTSREWNYIFLVSKGAGLLRDAVHLALAIQSDQGPAVGVKNVKNLVIQAFPSLRFGGGGASSSSGDPQLNDVLDMLQKLGA